MAKRGERLPWRVEFEWSNGVRGASSFSSLPRAELERDTLLDIERRSSRGLPLAVTVSNRDSGEAVFRKAFEE